MARMKRMKNGYHIKAPQNKGLGFTAGDIGESGDRAVADMVNRGKKMGLDF